MLIYAPAVLYAAFQRCRFGESELGPLFDALHAVVQRVRQTGALELDSDDPRLAAALADFPELAGGAARVSPANQALFDVVAIAVDDLRGLCARGEHLAMRNLGYALHNLPGMLAEAVGFDRQLYWFSFRSAAFHWHQLSSELRLAFARLVHETPEQLDALVAKPGFAHSMY